MSRHCEVFNVVRADNYVYDLVDLYVADSPRGNAKFSINHVFHSDLKLIHHTKKRKEVLHEIKFSPNGHFLAVGSNDNFVDIYQVKGSEFKPVAVCAGSSSFITHLDWSVDSKYLQTNSGASERLFYQIPSEQSAVL